MKASEKRLIAILLVLAVICGGAIIAQRLLKQQRGIERREQALELRQMESTAILAEAELWKERLGWLEGTQPQMTSENEASKELLESLLASASTLGLTVQKKQLHEPLAQPYYREVGVTLTLKGTLPAIFRWMHQALSPEAFCTVTGLKVVPDNEDTSNVIATVRFSRLYLPEMAEAEPPAK